MSNLRALEKAKSLRQECNSAVTLANHSHHCSEVVYLAFQTWTAREAAETAHDLLMDLQKTQMAALELVNLLEEMHNDSN